MRVIIFLCLWFGLLSYAAEHAAFPAALKPFVALTFFVTYAMCFIIGHVSLEFPDFGFEHWQRINKYLTIQKWRSVLFDLRSWLRSQ